MALRKVIRSGHQFQWRRAAGVDKHRTSNADAMDFDPTQLTAAPLAAAVCDSTDATAVDSGPRGCPPPDRGAADRGPGDHETPAGRAITATAPGLTAAAAAAGQSRRGCRLLLLRHGLAEERQPGRSDAERALSERGRQRTRAVLEQLVARGLVADRLLSSPLRRAHQTAQIAVHCGLAPALELVPELQPGGDLDAGLSSWLAAPDPPRRLLLVGHEPDLSLLAARLIGAPPAALRLRKAGLIQLHLPEPIGAGGAELELLLRPALLLS